jgi:S-adenosylmethionine:tRNA ribosyltransferase-isomerase
VRLEDYDYDLPEELIAQEPPPRRDASRLMVLERSTGRVEHRRFTDLAALLDPGDLVVLNDTRVLAARLDALRPTGGKVEILLVERVGGTEAAPEWRALLNASKQPRPGQRLRIAPDLEAEILDRDAEGWRLLLDNPSGDAGQKVEELGRMPLPPYIRREPADPRAAVDRVRYQTVFARRPGAVAAPTAGLHFTPELLGELEAYGVRLAWLTLHVGPGTFLPVRTERVEDHRMHAEAFELPEPTAEAIARARAVGRRVVAIGTTVARTLEGRAREDGTVRPGAGRCDLFIYPGHRFRVVDALLTNFHLPRSTLLLLVAAFAGREQVLAAYAEAVRRGYRFYSYGDAMLVRSA